MDPVIGLKELMNAAKDGKMKAILDPTSPYEMEQFVEMFEKQMSHTAHGKLVMRIKDVSLQKKEDLVDSVSTEKQSQIVEQDAKETVIDQSNDDNDVDQ